ncbi:MAG: glycosyltransferase family 39 protein [Phycisphaeraceae bacterium]
MRYLEQYRPHFDPEGNKVDRSGYSLVQPVWPILISTVSEWTGKEGTASYRWCLLLTSLFSVLLAWPMFFLTKELAGKRLALIAAATVVMLPSSFIYSLSVLPEAAFTLSTTFFFWSTLLWSKNRSIRNILFVVLSASAAFMLKPPGVVLFISATIMILWDCADRFGLSWRFRICGVLGIVCGLVAVGAGLVQGLRITFITNQTSLAQQWARELSDPNTIAALAARFVKALSYLHVATFGLGMPSVLLVIILVLQGHGKRFLRRLLGPWLIVVVGYIVIGDLILYLEDHSAIYIYGRYIDRSLPVIFVVVFWILRVSSRTDVLRRRFAALVVASWILTAVLAPSEDLIYANNLGYWTWFQLHRNSSIVGVVLGVCLSVMLFHVSVRLRGFVSYGLWVFVLVVSLLFPVVRLFKHFSESNQWRAEVSRLSMGISSEKVGESNVVVWLDPTIWADSEGTSTYVMHVPHLLEFYDSRLDCLIPSYQHTFNLGDMILSRRGGLPLRVVVEQGDLCIYIVD